MVAVCLRTDSAPPVTGCMHDKRNEKKRQNKVGSRPNTVFIEFCALLYVRTYGSESEMGVESESKKTGDFLAKTSLVIVCLRDRSIDYFSSAI